MICGAGVFIVFIFGALLGSFLNVCIYRMPKGESIVLPPSHCPKCNKNICWCHNIPILSYVALGGKCAFCHERISLRYPLVEILNASLFALLFVTFGLSVKFFIYSALTSALIVITFIDIDTYEIPDSISLGGLVLGLAFSAIFPAMFSTDSRVSSFLSSVIGALVGGAAIYATGVFGKILFRKEAMGGGDVKLMAMIGAILGWKLVLFTYFIAPIFGATGGILLKIKDGRDTIAYGPYLSLAAIISIFFGNRLLNYLFYRI